MLKTGKTLHSSLIIDPQGLCTKSSQGPKKEKKKKEVERKFSKTVQLLVNTIIAMSSIIMLSAFTCAK